MKKERRSGRASPGHYSLRLGESAGGPRTLPYWVRRSIALIALALAFTPALPSGATWSRGADRAQSPVKFIDLAFPSGATWSRGADRAQSPVKFIDYIELTGLLDPASVDFLKHQVESSGRSGSTALVVRVDNPAAVGVSTIEVVDLIADAPVPVVVWVAPRAARANSASAFMVASAHLGAAAPRATIGPADTSRVVNSTTPRSRRPAERRKLQRLLRARFGPEQAARMRTTAVGETEAESYGLVAFPASSLQELLEGIGGSHVRVQGKSKTLPSGPFIPRFHKMALLDRLLHGSVRPPAAYLLLLGGIFAILFELYNPGVGGAAISGGVAIGFSMYGLTILPTSWYAVAFILLGLALLTADLQQSGLGLPTWGGLAALLAGSLVLFRAAPSPMRLPWWAVLAGILGAVAFYFSIMPAAIRSRVARPLAGAENIVGTIGLARTDVAPEGQVMARGTLWRARTLGAAIPQGSAVEIKGVAGLMLMVEETRQQVPESSSHPGGE